VNQRELIHRIGAFDYDDLHAFWKIIQNYLIKFFQINSNVTVENDSQIKEFINEICISIQSYMMHSFIQHSLLW
jgi:hypothetical protein